MWMQNSAGGPSGNFHDRNRFGSQYAQTYSGGAPHSDAGDWKSKILESGQWLGGKVIEYGGKLARGPHSDSIPDHYAPQMPRNDGRANWMADIRSSSSGGGGGYTGGYAGGGYQNDFATERPKAYSEYSNNYSSNPSGPKPFGGYEPKSVNVEHHKSRHAKKKNDKKKKSKKQQSESESEELSFSESSIESTDERRHKSKTKKKKVKKHRGFYSESESEEDTKRKASADYSFSFDPAKLPPPPEKKTTKKKAKTKKNKKEKSSKKSRTRRQSMASTDDESALEKEEAHAKTKKRGSKNIVAATNASVDLLGVDLDLQPVTQSTTATRAQEVRSSIFDAPLHQIPMEDLAGLSFATPGQTPAPVPLQQSVFGSGASATPCNDAHAQPQQADAFRTTLLPENNIIDFSSLASEKKKTLSANPEEKRTLNDMQKARGADLPTRVLTMSMHGHRQMQQNMSGGMLQVSMNMNQLQTTDGVTGMQQQMYPNMQVPLQSMDQPQMQPQMMMMQPQMGMMVQPQMMNMQMMQQQQHQFAQGKSSLTQQTGTQQTSQSMMSGVSNSNSSDPFYKLP
ncbi:hypothetical protein PHMEG_00020718 [Phytophthora megakarya]|uniref:Uncharacterized protein n=1 Tax=Phytophthora megakarya TaxID=4795 RepID=A0A225VNN1_9STRA|nr:hypothetical protein PHMEG_00020718 [Phytophthora megakarya]